MTDEIIEEVRNWGMEPPTPFEITDLSTDEQTLWREFPDDYRAAIATINGGWLDEALYFDVPIVWEHEGHRREGMQTQLEELWTWRPLAEDPPEEVSSVLHEHFGRHVAEEFLPDGIFVIGRATQNSLVAISTRPEDHGAVYYWEWYWNYPWYKTFFEGRVGAALAAFSEPSKILEDPAHPYYDAVVDAANFATLLKVGSSFTDFVRGLHPERVE